MQIIKGIKRVLLLPFHTTHVTLERSYRGVFPWKLRQRNGASCFMEMEKKKLTFEKVTQLLFFQLFHRQSHW